MAAQRRCVVYLEIGFILLSLITGGQCQCGHSRVPRLHAGVVTGSIFSPGYPENYPDNARCGWRLYADPGHAIHVHVVWIKMEESTDCFYDALNFYDGDTTHHRKLGTACTDRVRDFYSSSLHMYVEFLSDFSVSHDGFELEYSAIKPSDVPATLAPNYPWPFPGDPTTMTTTTTTKASSGFNWPSYSVTALVGGVAGGLVLLFVVFALARYYMGRRYSGTRRQTARPYPPPSAPPPPASSTIYHNNNAVFMVSSSTTPHPFNPSSSSSSLPSAPYGGGVTNLAFSPFGEAPPAYFAVQQSTTVMQPGGGEMVVGGRYGPAPPSYTEAMRLSHPPAPPSNHHPARPRDPPSTYPPTHFSAQAPTQIQAQLPGQLPGQLPAELPAHLVGQPLTPSSASPPGPPPIQPPGGEATDRRTVSSSSASADRSSSAMVSDRGSSPGDN